MKTPATKLATIALSAALAATGIALQTAFSPTLAGATPMYPCNYNNPVPPPYARCVSYGYGDSAPGSWCWLGQPDNYRLSCANVDSNPSYSNNPNNPNN